MLLRRLPCLLVVSSLIWIAMAWPAQTSLNWMEQTQSGSIGSKISFFMMTGIRFLAASKTPTTSCWLILQVTGPAMSLRQPLLSAYQTPGKQMTSFKDTSIGKEHFVIWVNTLVCYLFSSNRHSSHSQCSLYLYHWSSKCLIGISELSILPSLSMAICYVWRSVLLWLQLFANCTLQYYFLVICIQLIPYAFQIAITTMDMWLAMAGAHGTGCLTLVSLPTANIDFLDSIWNNGARSLKKPRIRM